MNIEVQPQHIRAAIVLVIVFILCLTSFFGFRAGRDLAKSTATLQQTSATLQGLDYFFSDQDRYPSPTEFEDASVFGIYLSLVPIPNFASKLCPVTTAYDTFDERSFKFMYCLPRGVNGQVAGVHSLTERDIAAWK